MEIWTHFVDLLYDLLFNLSVAFGGNMGLAIAVVSFAVIYVEKHTDAALLIGCPMEGNVKDSFLPPRDGENFFWAGDI